MRGSAAFRVAVAPGGALAGPWVQNSLWTAARAVPSLDLRFADNKSLVDATTGASLVTFTRASTGTFVGSDGVLQTATTNEPRFDHNPTTGESLGLLVEEARTNLLLQSEDFSTSWTTSTATVTTNVATAPNGTTTADLYSGTSTSAVNQSVSLTSGVAYTISFYVKSAGLGNNNFRLRIDGTQTSSNFTATSEWQRFTFTATSANTAARSCGIIRNTANDNVDILIWGAQLEAGAFPTSYIPTTTATATRAADVASITGSNFSGWYNQTEGTVFADASTQQSAAGHVLAGVSTGGFADSAYLAKENTNFLVAAPNAAPSNLSIQLSTVSSNVGLRAVLAFTAGTGSASAVMNGGVVGTDASTGIPITMSQMGIGCAPWSIGANLWNGTIKRLAYWPVRLVNTLQAITQ